MVQKKGDVDGNFPRQLDMIHFLFASRFSCQIIFKSLILKISKGDAQKSVA